MRFSTADVLQNPEIVVGLKRAWLASEAKVPGGHEEGGFFVANDFDF